MNSDLPSPNKESNEQKAEFHKLTNEKAQRKYRRRSPMPVLSDEDGSPKRGHSSRRDSKASDYERRNDERGADRLASGSQNGRRSDSYRNSSRGDRHDEHSSHGKHADEDDRSHAKSSYRTGLDSRGGTHPDSRDRESGYNRSRDRYRDVDRYSRDHSDVAIKKYKEKEPSSDRAGYDGRRGSRYDDRDRYAKDKDHQDKKEYKNSRDHRSDRAISYEDSVGQRSDFNSKWDTGNVKDLDGSKFGKESNMKDDPLDRHGDKLDIAGRKAEHKSAFVSEDLAAKRPKLFSSEDTEAKKVDETSGIKAAVNGSESIATVDAAKVAAMKAAELVNKNLTGTGLMTADQKKKLLWGSKKSTTTQEPSHRWDSAMFSDRERQEKFNKLMTLRLPWYIWPIVGCEGRSEDDCKTAKQPRCGKTTSRSGEAIHCWSPTKGRPHRGFRTVKVYLGSSTGTMSICLIYVHLYENFVHFNVVHLYSLKV